MNCEAMKEELSAYLDKELAPAERQAIEQHVAGCANCKKELETAEKVNRAFLRYSAPKPPAGFVEKVLRNTAPAPVIPIWKKSKTWKVAAAAFVLFAGTWAILEVLESKPTVVSQPVVKEEKADDELLENLDVLENLDMAQDVELALALTDLSDEEFRALLSAIEEG